MFKVNLFVCQVLSAVCQFNSIEEAVSAVQIVLQSGVPIARIGWCKEIFTSVWTFCMIFVYISLHHCVL